MVVRKKNLLDAFQASAPEGRTAAKRGSEVRSSAGGPFAPVSSPAEPSPTSAPRLTVSGPTFAPSTETSFVRRILRDKVVRIALAFGAVFIVVSYWLGRQHGPAPETGDLASAPPGSGALVRSGAVPPASPSEAELSKRNLATAQAGSTHDQQFLNPVNKYTVRVKKFDNDASGMAAARALHDYFVKEDLPVILPISQGKSCYVYVGHADKKKDADDLANYIRRAAGPPPNSKKAAFQDAYVVNIDDVVKR